MVSATLGGTCLLASGSSELPGDHRVQLVSIACSWGSSQGLILSNSSVLRLFLRCLPLCSLGLVMGDGCGPFSSVLDIEYCSYVLLLPYAIKVPFVPGWVCFHLITFPLRVYFEWYSGEHPVNLPGLLFSNVPLQTDSQGSEPMCNSL